jgi:hypothetical protein
MKSGEDVCIQIAADISTRKEFSEVESSLILRIVQEAIDSFSKIEQHKWFVITGNNESDTPILLFTSAGLAIAYCSNDKDRKHTIYCGLEFTE